MTSPPNDTTDAGGVVRVVDVSFRGRSWQLHDTGHAVWFVYPWGSTAQVWARFRVVAGAVRGERWEAVNRVGEVVRFGSFADAAKFACVLPDRAASVDRADVVASAAARLACPGVVLPAVERSSGR